MTQPRPLTDEERSEIDHAIAQKTGAGDREPRLVIEEDYGGDSDRYMRVMAGWHHIPIGIERIFLKIKAVIGSVNISLSDVQKITGDVSQEEIGVLIAKLHELKKAAFSEVDRMINILEEMSKAVG